MSWPCFWLEPTYEAERALRRYTRGGIPSEGCAGGFHQAVAWLDERIPVALKHDPDGDWTSWDYSSGDNHPHDDPRWPSTCAACGHAFTDDDEWQDWTEPLYRRTDNGELRVLHPTILDAAQVEGVRTAEPGAMWDNFWLPRGWLNPDRPRDGVTPVVRCPYMDDRPGGQDWTIDSKSSNGGFWTRTGDPRQPSTFTASPSIAIGVSGYPGYYHGFLQAGVLTDHLG